MPDLAARLALVLTLVIQLGAPLSAPGGDVLCLGHVACADHGACEDSARHCDHESPNRAVERVRADLLAGPHECCCLDVLIPGAPAVVEARAGVPTSPARPGSFAVPAAPPQWGEALAESRLARSRSAAVGPVPRADGLRCTRLLI